MSDKKIYKDIDVKIKIRSREVGEEIRILQEKK